LRQCWPVSFVEAGLERELPRKRADLQMMINGQAIPTRAVIEGLAKELDFDVRYLEKLSTRSGRTWPKALARRG
jgi:hypothetical protein